MKKIRNIILIAAMAVISLTAVSCGETKENNNSIKVAEQTAAQAQTAELNKNDYSQIPQDAEKALNVAADRSEGAFETSGRRSFGYTGTADVKGSKCYCFSLFETKDESTVRVADIAVTADGGKVYSSKAGKNDYSELAEPAKASSWSDKQTKAFA